MLPPELNGVCPDEGDSYVVHPKICDLKMVPNLRRSNSGFCKSKRKAHFATGNNEKASLDNAKVRGRPANTLTMCKSQGHNQEMLRAQGWVGGR